MGLFLHPCEGEMVCARSPLQSKIPYFNAPIYLENKTQIGKVEEILGPMTELFFTVKLDAGVVAGSFKKNDKVRNILALTSRFILDKTSFYHLTGFYLNQLFQEEKVRLHNFLLLRYTEVALTLSKPKNHLVAKDKSLNQDAEAEAALELQEVDEVDLEHPVVEEEDLALQEAEALEEVPLLALLEVDEEDLLQEVVAEAGFNQHIKQLQVQLF